MKYVWVLLIFCASCTCRRGPPPSGEKDLSSKKHVSAEAKAADKEVQKILHWFEQTDAIFREALWVIRQQRAPEGKSIFGKFQRGLLSSMNQKLSNKSMFKCDVYSMRRDVRGLSGVPQVGHVYHRCNSKESFVHLGSWNHPKSNELTMSFVGSALAEVLGFATSILNPSIQCQIRANDAGIIETFRCENLMVDYNPAKNQVLRFKQFEYVKSAKSILHLKAEVLENLDPVRKIEVEVPMEGTIKVTETVLQAPEYLATQVPGSINVTPTPRGVAIPTVDLQHPSIPPDDNPNEVGHVENSQDTNIPAPQGFEGAVPQEGGFEGPGAIPYQNPYQEIAPQDVLPADPAHEGPQEPSLQNYGDQPGVLPYQEAPETQQPQPEEIYQQPSYEPPANTR